MVFRLPWDRSREAPCGGARSHRTGHGHPWPPGRSGTRAVGNARIVTQKSVAKSSILRRPLDQTGNVRHRDGTKVIRIIDHPNGRNQGREGIGINLRTGVGKNVEESRFSRIGETYQPDVGDCLEGKDIVSPLPRVFPRSFGGASG